MNLTEEGAASGTDAINKMLVATGYKLISQSVPTNKAGLSIIYHPEKVGELKHVQCVDNPNQNGRPVLMLVTELGGKNYLSVSIHGAQDPKLRLDKDAFNAYMVEKNKNFLESCARAFLDSNGIDIGALAGIFIMGDFNDRYDGITDIKIGEKVASYSGVAPKSCCHNWDSSCAVEDVEKDFGGGYMTCKEPAAEAIRSHELGKLPLPGDRGATKNYKYAGDKVFGLNPKSDMAIYRPAIADWDGVSMESDHELVYASFGSDDETSSSSTTSRRRRTCRRTQGRRSQRRSRRH
jgi:hypothetical protein